MDHVLPEDIPQICPKCGWEFDMQEDISYDQTDDGVASTLICGNEKCDFRLLLAFDSNAEIEERMNEDEEDSEDD